MALVIKDRVLETSTTTGTGTLTLAGATTGYQSFSTAIGNTNTTYYTISTPTGSEWEVGLGTVGAGTLARTSILASSNGGSAVNFSAGVKDVFGTYPAGRAVASTGALTSGRVTYATTDGAVTDSANFTFNGTTVTTANDASISGLTVGKGGGAVATNTAIGVSAMSATSTNGANTALGYQALTASTSGGSNVALGYQALQTNTTVSQLVAVGTFALKANTTGTSNTAVGYQALQANTTGLNNTGVGNIALTSNTTGGHNTALGHNSLIYNVTGNYNTAVGQSALLNNTASNNTAVGYQALNANTTASNNVAVGYQTMRVNTTGIQNVGVGSQDGNGYTSLHSNTTGNYNISIGPGSLGKNTTGSQNVVMGPSALQNNLTSSDNLAIGFQVGFSVTGAQNTLLGSKAGFSGTNDLTTGSNNIIIGYNAAASSATVSNEVTIGNSSVTTTRLRGNLGVAGTQPAAWGTSTGAIDASYAALSFDNTTGNTFLTNNLYQTSVSPVTWNVKTSASTTSAYYGQVAGAHNWQYATTGAIGSAVTLVPQMSILTSGVLNVGNQSTAGINLNSLQSSGGSANFNFCLLSAGTATGRIAALRQDGSFATSLIFSTAVSGGTLTEALRIDSSQNVLLRGPGGLGYGTGSGGAVTQATSRTTGVTLNKTNGAITLVSAAGLATYQSFTVTNSTVAATDTIIVNQKSGTDKNIILVTNVAAGSFEITFATTGGTTTEQPVFNFAVIKAVTA